LRYEINNKALSSTIRELETSLHQPEIRANRQRLDELLHQGFQEFGRSGRIYLKADIVEDLPTEQSRAVIWSQDFSLRILADGVVLLTYKSANLTDDGVLERHALRASIWQRSPTGWQMRFHQGTPTAPFDKSPR
jgi:hypothetical protein